MALTKAHFSKNLSLAPLTEYEVTRSKDKIARLLKKEICFSPKFNSELPAPPNLLKTNLKLAPLTTQDGLPRSGDYSLQFYAERSWIAKDLTPNVLTYSSSEAEEWKKLHKIAVDSTSDVKVKLVKKESVEGHKVQSVPPHAKKVSFALSHVVTNGQTVNGHNKNLLMDTEKSVVFSSIPKEKYPISKQEGHVTPTDLPERLQSVSSNKQRNSLFITVKNSNKEHLSHNKFNDRLPSNGSSFKGRSLAQKVQTRRGKGYLIKHKLPKLAKRPDESTLVQSHNESQRNPVLQKALHILLQKVQNQPVSNNKRVDTRRLIVFPSLAAPCSEEFAVVMRRIYGKKYVSSANVLDHAVKRQVPLRETAMLLDAIMRPPSRPVS